MTDREEPGPRRSVINDAAFALLAQVTTGAFTAALTIYLVRALGPHGYGLFGLTVSIGAVGLLVCDLGVSNSAARFIAEDRSRRSVTAAIMAAALQLKLVITGAVSLILAVAAGPLAQAYGQPELTWPLRAMAVSLLGESLLLLFMRAFMAAGRLSRTVAVTFMESAVETSASIALVAVGAGAGGAVLGRAMGYLAGAATGAVVALRIFGRARLRVRPPLHSRRREILGYALPLLVTESAYTIYGAIDVLLIGALLSATDVSFFSAPLRMITLLGYVGQSVANAVAPRMARSQDQEPDVISLRSSLRWLMIFQALLVAPVIVWAEPVVQLLFGNGYGRAAAVLVALTPFIFLRGLSPLISATVNYLGEAGRRLPIVLGALAVNVLVDVLLLPRIGVVAAGIGTSLAYCVYVPGHWRICRRTLTIPLRPLAATLARSAAATVAMAAILLAGRAAGGSVFLYLAAGALGALVFCATLLLTGEISVAEVRAAVSAGRRLGRAAGRSAGRQPL